jgi:ribosomal RNA-processing protein 7
VIAIIITFGGDIYVYYYRPKRKKRKKELNLKLYNFQQREAQRERVAELRKKFQEDRELIASMKANRKFKPF